MTAYADELELHLCPTCHGRPADVGACGQCDGLGVLDQHGAPFSPPAPWDNWTPAALVNLYETSRSRHERTHSMPDQPDQQQPAAATKPRRLTHSDIIERLTERRPSSSKVELDYKKAPGDPIPRTTWHLEVSTGFDADELRDAAEAARKLHDELLAAYAIAGGDDA